MVIYQQAQEEQGQVCFEQSVETVLCTSLAWCILGNEPGTPRMSPRVPGTAGEDGCGLLLGTSGEDHGTRNW